MSAKSLLLVLGVSLAALVIGAGTVVVISKVTGDDDPSAKIAVATASLTNDMAGLLGDIDSTASSGREDLPADQRDRLRRGAREADALASRARTDLAADDPARPELVRATREVRTVLADTTAAAGQGRPAVRATARLGRRRLQRVNARLQEANRRQTFGAQRLDAVADAQRGAGLEDVDLPYTAASVEGSGDGQLLGSSVAPAGDVNDDGRDDVIAAAPGSGEAFVLLGGGARGHLSAGELGPSEAVRISGLSQTELYQGDDETEEDAEASSQALGRVGDVAVAGVGDLDGDGYDDIAVGARSTDGAGGEDSGAAFVIYGAKQLDGVDVGSLGDRGFRLDGPGPFWYLGMDVAGGRDVNGDGSDDLVVGGREHRGSQAGTFAEGPAVTWMIPGGKRRTGTVRLDRRRPPARGWRVQGIGTHLAVSEDVNGDGLGDVIGGDAYNRMDSPGSAAIVYGRRASPVSLSLRGSGRGLVPVSVSNGTLIGTGAQALGDVNDDGFADLGLVSRTPDGAGRAHVIFGGRRMGKRYRLDRRDTGGTATVYLGRMRGSRGWADDGLGAAGDLDRDGHADLLLASAPVTEDAVRLKSGGTVVASGARLGRGTRTTVRALAGSGATVEYSGVDLTPLDDYYDDVKSATGAGDVDGDGQADLAIGVPRLEVPDGSTETTRLAGGVFVANRSAVGTGRGPLEGTFGPRGLGIVKVGRPAGGFAGRVGGQLSDFPGGTCGVLSTRDARVSFLSDRGRVTRVEVTGPGYLTESGIQVGDPARLVEQAYPRTLRREQHQYYRDGQYLKVRDRRGGRLNFSVNRGRVSEIWAGVEPDVDFVEGCA